MTNPTIGKLNELVNKLCERDKSLNADEVKKQILAWALGALPEKQPQARPYGGEYDQSVIGYNQAIDEMRAALTDKGES